MIALIVIENDTFLTLETTFEGLTGIENRIEMIFVKQEVEIFTCWLIWSSENTFQTLFVCENTESELREYILQLDDFINTTGSVRINVCQLT